MGPVLGGRKEYYIGRQLFDVSNIVSLIGDRKMLIGNRLAEMKIMPVSMVLH